MTMCVVPQTRPAKLPLPVPEPLHHTTVSQQAEAVVAKVKDQMANNDDACL